jgi:hypothetical protein
MSKNFLLALSALFALVSAKTVEHAQLALQKIRNLITPEVTDRERIKLLTELRKILRVRIIGYALEYFKNSYLLGKNRMTDLIEAHKQLKTVCSKLAPPTKNEEDRQRIGFDAATVISGLCDRNIKDFVTAVSLYFEKNSHLREIGYRQLLKYIEDELCLAYLKLADKTMGLTPQQVYQCRLLNAVETAIINDYPLALLFYTDKQFLFLTPEAIIDEHDTYFLDPKIEVVLKSIANGTRDFVNGYGLAFVENIGRTIISGLIGCIGGEKCLSETQRQLVGYIDSILEGSILTAVCRPNTSEFDNTVKSYFTALEYINMLCVHKNSVYLACDWCELLESAAECPEFKETLHRKAYTALANHIICDLLLQAETPIDDYLQRMLNMFCILTSACESNETGKHIAAKSAVAS